MPKLTQWTRKVRSHFVIPDTQVKKGVALNHLTAAGNYIAAHKPNVIVHLCDHYDMPSLSEYDKGKKVFEGRRYADDIAAGDAGLELLMGPINRMNAARKKKGLKLYKPRKVATLGNHEYRINRLLDIEPRLEGAVSLSDLKFSKHGFEVYEFLKPVEIDGVWYAHFFHPANSPRPYGGRVHTRLNTIGFSFTMGHQQGLDVAVKGLGNGRTLRGLVCGSFYQHDEEYKGPQGNNHWRGAIMKHEVKDGNYCLLELSLSYLLAQWQ